MSNDRGTADSRRTGARFAVAFAVLAALCVWALLPGLETAAFTSPDEYRALSVSKFHTPLFSALYRLVLGWVGLGEPQAILLTASLGLLVLVSIVLISTVEGHPLAGILAAGLLALQASWVLHARTAYPCMLASLLLLASLHTLVRWECSRSRIQFWVASLLAAAAVSAYLPSYAVVAGLGLGATAPLPSWRERVVTICRWCTLTLLWWIVITALLTSRETGSLDLPLAWAEFSRFRKITALFVEAGVAPIVRTWGVFLRQEGISGLALPLAILGLWRPGGGPFCRFAAWVGLFSLGVYSAMAMAGAHTYYVRHLVLFLPFLTIGAGHFLSRLPRRALVPAVIVLCAACLGGIARVHEHTFSIEPIRLWCARHGVAETALATAVDLEQGVRPKQRRELPFTLVGYPFGRVLIQWPAVEELYRTGQIEYVLTSGTGTKASLGLDDARLATAKAVMSWPHPYHFYGHPFSTDEQRARFTDFALYRLADVLGRPKVDGDD